jgi:HEAT repeat protein
MALRINGLRDMAAAIWLGAGTAAAKTGTLDAALARLAEDDVLVADAAVEEIVAFGAPAVDSLSARLDHPGRDVRAGAIRGLGLLGDPKAAPALRAKLRESLERREPDTMETRYLRILLLQAVGRLRDAESAPLLREAAASRDPFERTHAGLSLMAMAQDPGYDLVRESSTAADPALRALVADGLRESSDARARDFLLVLAGDEAWVVRDAAYRALVTFRADPAVVKALERGSADPNWFVRQTVAETAASDPRGAGGDRDRVDPPRGER